MAQEGGNGQALDGRGTDIRHALEELLIHGRLQRRQQVELGKGLVIGHAVLHGGAPTVRDGGERAVHLEGLAVVGLAGVAALLEVGARQASGINVGDPLVHAAKRTRSHALASRIFGRRGGRAADVVGEHHARGAGVATHGEALGANVRLY